MSGSWRKRVKDDAHRDNSSCQYIVRCWGESVIAEPVFPDFSLAEIWDRPPCCCKASCSPGLTSFDSLLSRSYMDALDGFTPPDEWIPHVFHQPPSPAASLQRTTAAVATGMKRVGHYSSSSCARNVARQGPPCVRRGPLAGRPYLSSPGTEADDRAEWKLTRMSKM